jgi:hypothetical protein
METFVMDYPVLIVYCNGEVIDGYPHHESHKFPLTQVNGISLRAKTRIMEIEEFLLELISQSARSS